MHRWIEHFPGAGMHVASSIIVEPCARNILKREMGIAYAHKMPKQVGCNSSSPQPCHDFTTSFMTWFFPTAVTFKDKLPCSQKSVFPTPTKQASHMAQQCMCCRPLKLCEQTRQANQDTLPGIALMRGWAWQTNNFGIFTVNSFCDCESARSSSFSFFNRTISARCLSSSDFHTSGGVYKQRPGRGLETQATSDAWMKHKRIHTHSHADRGSSVLLVLEPWPSKDKESKIPV